MAYYILILLTAVLLLVFLTLLLRKLQYIVTFQPRREIQETPAVLNLAYNNITFKDASGNNISGWFVKAADTEKTILFCHGSGGNLSHRVDTVAAYASIGLNCVVFDYAGYGNSTGTPSEEAFYEGADAAFDYLVKTEGIPPHNIIVVGRSLGGAPAALLARHYSPAGLILESSVCDFGMAAHDRLKIVLPGFMLRYSFATEKILSSVSCPVLLIASRDDTVVKFRNSKQLAKAAPADTKLLELTGDHDDCYFFCRQKYLDAIKDFISRVKPEI